MKRLERGESNLEKRVFISRASIYKQGKAIENY